MSRYSTCATLSCSARATMLAIWRAEAARTSLLCAICADRWRTLTTSLRPIRDEGDQ